MAKKKAPAAKKKAPARRKKGPEPGSRGLEPGEALKGAVPAAVGKLEKDIAADGGAVVSAYRDPLGGMWQVLAVLPVEKVQPTPFQRDLSAAHVKRLGEAIDGIDRFLDPVIVVRNADGVYWTPNGHHRTQAMRELGARSITCLVLPETDMAFKILALNTEKAHNLKEKSLEVIRMARALADIDPAQPEKTYAVEFEEPGLLTLGACYEQKARFSGSAYNPTLKRVDAFLDRPITEAVAVREERSGLLFEVDEAVVAAVAALKDRGFTSPYLKAFVVARVNPLGRGTRGKVDASFEETFEKMRDAARKFDAAKVRMDQVAGAAGGPPED